jgi:hypothetical protein
MPANPNPHTAVTQADLDAAAEYNRRFPELRLSEAFARHRLAHTPSPELVEALTASQSVLEAINRTDAVNMREVRERIMANRQAFATLTKSDGAV